MLVRETTGSDGPCSFSPSEASQGETPSVTNVGTNKDAILDFVLVKGRAIQANGVGVLPDVTSADVGKVLTVDSAGLWGAAMPAK